MAKVLESLIAKGRRARRPAEQKEVAFGLADLSTHEELLERLVQKGGVKSLLYLLTKSIDADAQRFAALALGNAASAAFNRIRIASEGAVITLIDFMKNQESDIVARQYCAMALGNLAAEPENHMEIVKSNGIDALITVLKSEDVEGGRYAAFALANLAANANHRERIVEENAVPALVALACSEDINAQRQAMAALRGLCISPEYRAIVVREGVLDPLVLMSRSEEVEVLREVSAALNNLSSIEENKMELADRAMCTVIGLMLSGDTIVERHAVCCAANLMEMLELNSRLIEERGVAPLVALASNEDANSRGEACRCLANLTLNADVHQVLLKEGALAALVGSLSSPELNCQRYASLSIANLATTVAAQVKIIQCGAVRPLINLALNPLNQIEARRYAVLALANLTATTANHMTIIEDNGIPAFLSLCNSPDLMSQYYVGCALANLTCSLTNHPIIVEAGGIQAIIALLCCADPDVHQQAAAALRGLSVTFSNKMKIVQEGALAPLTHLLASDDVEILREVIACFANLSICDENKNEIVKAGALTALISLMQSTDMTISSQSCATLANLAEFKDNQDLIVLEGAVRPTITVMRSKYIEVQRESGRLLANLCASEAESTNLVIEGGGHNLLISYLLSNDTACQRVGSMGICNLCTQERYRKVLITCGVLEPLCSLARSEDVELEIQRYAVLAIANLASATENHQTFVDDGMLSMLISLSTANDAEVRQFAAYACVKLAQNAVIRDAITEAGGLEPVLYLSRTDEATIQRQVLPALCCLSFHDTNKVPIVRYGGLECIVRSIRDQVTEVSRLAACTIANLAEMAVNFDLIHDSGAINNLVAILSSPSEEVKREAARALGNLAANIELGDVIIREGALQYLIPMLRSMDYLTQRMSSMALCNLSSNIRNQSYMLDAGLFDPLLHETSLSLDPKSKSDHECTRYCLLTLTNLAVSPSNQGLIMDKAINILAQFSKHRDIKCRQHAVFCVGNLCSNLENLEHIMSSGALRTLITYAFPSSDSSTNVQFQAVAALRGLAAHPILRVQIVREGALEPLIMAAKSNSIEVQREAAAAMCNLAVSEENKVTLARGGALPALVSLAMSSDPQRELHSVCALANIAEMVEGRTHERMIEEGVMKPLLRLADSNKIQDNTTNTNIPAVNNNIIVTGTTAGVNNPATTNNANLDASTTVGAGNVFNEIRREVARCFALFASKRDSHATLVRVHAASKMMTFSRDKDDIVGRYGILGLGNLAVSRESHQELFDVGAVGIVIDIARYITSSVDLNTRRAVAFTLNNIAVNPQNHAACERLGLARSLLPILADPDKDTNLQALLATRHLCESAKFRNQFVEINGINSILELGTSSEDVEIKREISAALRNLSLSIHGKVVMVREKGLVLLAELMQSPDVETCHQSTGVVANLAEAPENQALMVDHGMIQHLKYVLRSKSIDVQREAARALSNISAEYTYAPMIVSAGTLQSLISALSSPDYLCQRYAAMGIGNLACHPSNQKKIIQEGGLPMLISIAQFDNGDLESQRYAALALTNLSASKANHALLVQTGCLTLFRTFFEHDDIEIRNTSIFAIANLSSNPNNHSFIVKEGCLERLIDFLKVPDKLAQYRAVSALRGLSTDAMIRLQIVQLDAIPLILGIAQSHHMGSGDGAGGDDTGAVELQMEALTCLCNLSLCGALGDNPLSILQIVDIQQLIAFLCSADSTFRLFGALTLGNIAANQEYHSNMLESGILGPLVTISNQADIETQRCIAYALVNLCADPKRRHDIVREGGLFPLISLACSEDLQDELVALSSLRGILSQPLNRRAVYQANLQDALRLGTKANNLEIRCEVASIFHALSVNDENKLDMAREDMLMGCVIDLLKNNEHPRILRPTMACLANLTERQECHPFLRRHHIHQIIVPHLLRAKNHIHHLSNMMNNDAAMNNNDDADKVIEENQDLGLLRESVRCMANLASIHANHPPIINEGGIPALLSSMQHRDALSTRFSVLGVVNLSSLPDNLSDLIHCQGLIETLIDLAHGGKRKWFHLDALGESLPDLDSEDDHFIMQQELHRSSQTTYNLQLKDKNANNIEFGNKNNVQVQITANKTLPAIQQPEKVKDNDKEIKLIKEHQEQMKHHLQTDTIVNNQYLHSTQCNSDHQFLLLHHYDLEARRYAALALGNIAMTTSSHGILARPESLLALRSCLMIPDNETRFNGAFALNKIALNHDNIDFLGDYQGGIIQPLVQLLTLPEEYSTKGQAIACLRHLAYSINNRVKMLESFILDPLAKLAEETTDPEILRELMALTCQLSLSDVLRYPMVMSSRLLVKLSELSCHLDVEIARFATATLANLAEAKRCHKTLVTTSGIHAMHNLIFLMRSKHASIAREASRGVSNLLTSHATHRLFLDDGGLVSLFRLCKSLDNETLLHCALIYRKLSPILANHEYIMAKGGLAPLLQLTGSEMLINIRLQAAAALRDFSSNLTTKSIIAEEGGLKISIALAQDMTSLEIRIIALGIMRHLAINSRVKRPMVLQGGLVPIFQAVEDESQDPDLLRQAAAVMSILAEQGENQLSLIKDGAIPRLIHLSRCKTLPDVRQDVAKTYALLTSNPENQQGIFGSNEVLSILTLCESTKKGSGLDTMSMASGSQIIDDNASHGGQASVGTNSIYIPQNQFPNTVPSNSDASNNSAYFDPVTISNAMMDKMTRQGHQQAPNTNATGDGVVGFNGSNIGSSIVLEEGEENCLRDALIALGNLAFVSKNQELIFSLGALTVLLDALSATPIYESVQRYSVRLLYRLAAHSELQELITQNPALIHQLNKLLLSCDSMLVRKYILMVFCNLSCKVSNQALLASYGVLAPIIQNLNSTDEEIVSRYAAMCLTNLANNPQNQIAITQLGGVSQLIFLASKEGMEAARYAGMALANLATNRHNRRVIVQSMGLPPLIQMSFSKNLETQRAAGLACYHLSAAIANHLSMVQSDVIPALSHLGSSDDHLCKMYAIMTMANLAANIETRVYSTRSGALQTAIALLKDLDVNVRRYACIALGNMANNRNTQEQVVVHGALPAIMNMALNNYNTSNGTTASAASAAAATANANTLNQSKFALKFDFKNNDKTNGSSAASDKVNVSISNTSYSNNGSDIESQRLALLSLSNLAANELNHSAMINKGYIKICTNAYQQSLDEDVKCYAAFGLANLCSNNDYLTAVGRQGGIPALVYLAQSTNINILGLGLAALRRLAHQEENWQSLILYGFLDCLAIAGKSNYLEVQREVAASLCSLTLSKLSAHRLEISYKCLPVLVRLASIAGSNHTALSNEQGQLKDTLTDGSMSPKSFQIPPDLPLSIDVIVEQGNDYTNHSPTNNTTNNTNHTNENINTQLLNHRYILADIARQSIGAIANLAEDIDTHEYIAKAEASKAFIAIDKFMNIDIQREATRCICNLLSSFRHQNIVIDEGIEGLIKVTLSSDDMETLYHCAMAFRKLAPNIKSHYKIVINHGYEALLKLISIHQMLTIQIQSLAAMRDIVANPDYQLAAAESGSIRILISLLRSNSNNTNKTNNTIEEDENMLFQQEEKLIALVLASIRHLSNHPMLKQIIVQERILRPVLKAIALNIEDINLQCAGIIANLSELFENQVPMVEEAVCMGLLTLAFHKNNEIQQDTSRAFANLAANEEVHVTLYKQGAITALSHLINLSTPNNPNTNTITNTIINTATTNTNTNTLSTNDITQKYASMALRFLASDPEVRIFIVQNQQLQVFINCAHKNNSLEYRRTAATAFASFTLHENNKYLLMKNNHAVQAILSLLLDKSTFSNEEIHEREVLVDDFMKGTMSNNLNKNKLNHDLLTQFTNQEGYDLSIQRDSSFALANLTDTPDIQNDLVREGILPVLKEVAKRCQDVRVQRDIARCYANLSQTEDIKQQILQIQSLSSILQLCKSLDTSCQRYSTLTIANLCSCSLKTTLLDQGVLKVILFLLKFPDADIQRFAALAVAGVALGTPAHYKIKMIEEGVMKPLVDLIRLPIPIVQLASSLAINAIILGSELACQTSVLTENGVEALINVLTQESAQEHRELLHAALFCLGSACESTNDHIKTRFVENQGIFHVVQCMVKGDMEIKRAGGYCLATISEQVEYHQQLVREGAMPAILSLALLEDIESQEYAAFSLAHLSSNKDLQVPLVNMGVVRPLVSMLSSDNEPKHYAGLALLKLADNFENHLKIAEEGGIQALLRLGRTRTTDDQLQYKAALTLGQLASNAVKLLPTAIQNANNTMNASKKHANTLSSTATTALDNTAGLDENTGRAMAAMSHLTMNTLTHDTNNIDHEGNDKLLDIQAKIAMDTAKTINNTDSATPNNGTIYTSSRVTDRLRNQINAQKEKAKEDTLRFLDTNLMSTATNANTNGQAFNQTHDLAATANISNSNNSNNYRRIINNIKNEDEVQALNQYANNNNNNNVNAKKDDSFSTPQRRNNNGNNNNTNNNNLMSRSMSADIVTPLHAPFRLTNNLASTNPLNGTTNANGTTADLSNNNNK